MDEVLKLLENYKLEKFYDQFVELGIEDVKDFIDGVTDEDLDNMSKIYQKKNLEKCINTYFFSSKVITCLYYNSNYTFSFLIVTLIIK